MYLWNWIHVCVVYLRWSHGSLIFVFCRFRVCMIFTKTEQAEDEEKPPAVSEIITNYFFCANYTLYIHYLYCLLVWFTDYKYNTVGWAAILWEERVLKTHYKEHSKPFFLAYYNCARVQYWPCMLQTVCHMTASTLLFLIRQQVTVFRCQLCGANCTCKVSNYIAEMSDLSVNPTFNPLWCEEREHTGHLPRIN